MPTKTLTALEAEAAAAQAAYEAAQQAAEAARQQAEAQRADRGRVFDQRLVDEYDDQALYRATRLARQAFDQAVAESPLGTAWVELKMAEARHGQFAAERNAAAARLGQFDATVQSRPSSNAMFEEIGRAVDRVTAERIADEMDARDAAREAAVNGK